MGGHSLFATPLELWKERRSSFLTNSTCGSFVSSSPDAMLHDHDMDSVYTHRSSCSSQRTRARRMGTRSSLPAFEEGDERFSALALDDNQADAAPAVSTKMFASATVRVWKQAPLPEWMNVFVPRFVRLQAGPKPFMEYTRQKDGPVRQRVMLTTATRLERLPKNKLVIDFHGGASADRENPKAYVAHLHKKQKLNPASENPLGKNNSSSRDRWLLRFETKQERDQWAKKIQDTIDLLAWISKFTIGNIMVDTSMATLAECFGWSDQQVPSYVMKVMQTATKQQAMNARNESRVHHLLTNFSSHPNVVALHDSFRQQERAYLIMEYCAGGDLFEYIRRDGAMDEATAKILFRRIVEALAYIHEQGVVHLDIKPENLLFKSSPLNPRSIKIADFGSAQVLAEANRNVKAPVSCTVGYAAPEVLERGLVSFAADIFSAGAVLYTILGGYAPFQSPSDEEAMDRTLTGDFAFHEDDWAHVSAQAKDLICGMLEIDPASRMSMDEVLDHPWLQ